MLQFIRRFLDKLFKRKKKVVVEEIKPDFEQRTPRKQKDKVLVVPPKRKDGFDKLTKDDLIKFEDLRDIDMMRYLMATALLDGKFVEVTTDLELSTNVTIEGFTSKLRELSEEKLEEIYNKY